MNSKFIFVSRTVHLSLGWLVIVAVVGLSLVPNSSLPSAGFAFEDKIAHTLTYAGLAWWFGSVVSRAKYWRLAALLISLGGFIEICQSFTPYRFASLADVIANTFGVGIGLALVVWLVRDRSTGSH